MKADALHMDGEYNAKNPGSLANRRTGRSWTPFLSGMAYVRSIKDITIHGESVGTQFRARHLGSVLATAISLTAWKCAKETLPPREQSMRRQISGEPDHERPK